MRDEPWDAVLTRWWPRLVPGAVASAAHGLIRTGHAVRALREEATAPRLVELGYALGYWAARWQPVPRPEPTRGSADVGVALDSLPARQLTGGIRTRLASLADDATWPAVLGAVEPVADPLTVPAALDALVDAAVTRYGRWGQAAPVMLFHSATAPRAVALVLPPQPARATVAGNLRRGVGGDRHNRHHLPAISSSGRSRRASRHHRRNHRASSRHR